MLLNALAYFILPLYTILFAGNTDWIHSNFSIIRNGSERRVAFLLWGILLTLYFYLSMSDIIHMLSPSAEGTRGGISSPSAESTRGGISSPSAERTQKGLTLWGNFLSRVSLILLVLTILTPYKPEVFPFFSSLHVWFAFTCPFVLMVCLLLILLACRNRNPTLYRPFFWGFWGITAACGAFYFSAGMINSALEVFFITSCCIFVRRIHRRLCP